MSKIKIFFWLLAQKEEDDKALKTPARCLPFTIWSCVCRPTNWKCWFSRWWIPSFKSENKLAIHFIVKNKDKRLTKTFNSKGKSNGAFKADIAVLETDFTQQLTELLTKALANTEIQEVLK